MGTIRNAFDQAHRDFVTDGVSSSGLHEPRKSELRALGAMIETALGNVGLGTMISVIKTTKALLDADLAHAANSVGLVYADATAANNDIYVKSGAPGAGSWTNSGSLHAAVEGAAAPFVSAAEAAAAAAEAVEAALAAPPHYSLWPDDRYAVSRGNRGATVEGQRLYSDYYTDAVWDADHEHVRGKGAWKHGAADGLFGIPVYFGSGAAHGAKVAAGDVISFGAIIEGAGAGQGLSAGLRFFGTHDLDFITDQETADLATNGDEQLLVLNNKTIPAGAGGAMVYFYGTSSPGHFWINAFWSIDAASAGTAPPSQMSPTALGGAISQAGPLGEARQGVDWALLTTTALSWSAATEVFDIARIATAARDLPFFGWAAAWATPSELTFNAVRLPRLGRSREAVALWRTIGVVVRTHATDASASGSTVVAVGSVTVDPSRAPLTDVVIPLRDPSGALVTLTEAELNADLFVGYYALDEAGGPAAISETTAVVSGITQRQSYYISTGNPLAPGTWSNFGSAMGIELVQLDGLQIGRAAAPTPALELALGLGGPWRSDPAPEALVLAPRAYGVVGRQTNVYFANLHSAVGNFAYDVDGIVAQFEDCWRLEPVAPATNQTLKFQLLTPSRRGVLSERTQRLDVVAANAPAGAVRKVLALGDSTTEAGKWTARFLANAAANAQSVQPTMIGTLGTGANKHEGRGGWTMQRYYQPSGADVALSPFVTSEGDKFNMAQYLLDTGQAAPDIFIPHLAINDVVALTADVDVHSVMDTYLMQLDQIIGLDVAADVGSLKESNAAVATLIGVPIAAPHGQDGMGFVAGVGQTNGRYRRNITIAAHRIIEHYRGAEADKVFLVGWNAVVDPMHSYDRAVRIAHAGVPYSTYATYAAAVADLAPSAGTLAYCTDADVWLVKVGVTMKGTWREALDVDGVLRKIGNDVHPSIRGYNQKGDGMTDAVNVLVALGLI